MYNTGRGGWFRWVFGSAGFRSRQVGVKAKQVGDGRFLRHTADDAVTPIP